MTPLDAMRDALEEIICVRGVDDAAEIAADVIDALNRRNVILVAVDPHTPLFIQTRDSGK